MAKKGVIEHTLSAYLKHIKLISFFSLAAFIALLIPLFVGTPTYATLGSMNLRIWSVPDLTIIDIAILSLTFLSSLFLISFAIVAINLVIKSDRTHTSIRKEVVAGVRKYAFNIFWIFLGVELLLFALQLITFELRMQEILYPLLSFAVFIPVFFAPPALVIDDLRPWRALEKSVSLFFSKFPYVLLWTFSGFIAFSAMAISLFLLPIPHSISEILILAINSIFILPLLVVFQTQIYMSKYTILD